MPLVTIRKPGRRPSPAPARKPRPYHRGGTLDHNATGHIPSDTWSLDFNAERMVDWSALDSDDRWDNS